MVIANQPWHLDECFFMIKALTRNEQPSTVVNPTVSLWIQALVISVSYQNKAVIRSIASRVGSLIAFDKQLASNPEDFVRFRVDLEFDKPPKNSVIMCFDGEPIWLPLRYEGLPSFWYCCGIICHFFKKCKLFVGTFIPINMCCRLVHRLRLLC